MNPYYDPEWSVLPPENNRRYVQVYNTLQLKNKQKQKFAKDFYDSVLQASLSLWKKRKPLWKSVFLQIFSICLNVRLVTYHLRINCIKSSS